MSTVHFLINKNIREPDQIFKNTQVLEKAGLEVNVSATMIMSQYDMFIIVWNAAYAES